MYFVEKMGVYGHGVFWIGESIEDGVAAANELSEADRDDHHDWFVYEFVDQDDSSMDASHKVVYRKTKGCDGIYLSEDQFTSQQN